MSSSNSTLKSTPTFQVNDRVEALWLEDGKRAWHPAEVLEVKSNNMFRIRFDGYVEEYDFKKKKHASACARQRQGRRRGCGSSRRF